MAFDAPTPATIPNTGKPPKSASTAIYRAENPDYTASISRWERMRAVITGAEAVKARGATDLPALHEQSPADYERYKARAVFANFTGRTLAALVGLLMRKSPEVKTEDAMEKFMGDVDLQGSSFNEYVREVCEEMNGPGHGGTLIDWSNEEQRPYFAHYRSEDVTNWHVERQAGRNVLVLLTLREDTSTLNRTTLEHEHTEIFRVYELIDGKVMLTTSRVQAGAETSAEQVELKRRGKALTAIPFIPHTVKGAKMAICKAPLEDMVEINLSHYRTSADLENGRHLAGLPTPYAFGFDPKQDLVMGTTHAWISDNHDAKVGFLEFTGSGLTDLKDALKEKQEQMAIMGARMIEPEKREAEAFTTVKLRADAEQATLVNIAEAASATISLALQWAAWWMGTKATLAEYAEENYIVLPTDFVAARMDGQTFTSLVGAFQMGAISWPTFFYNLQQGELYPDNWSQEDEEAAMKTAPVLTPPKGPEPKPDPNADPNAPPKKEPAPQA
jgi:hypothetical protein